jgi:hypothetical protein
MKTTDSATMFATMGVAATLLVLGMRAMGINHTIFSPASVWYTLPTALVLGTAAYIGLIAMVETAWASLVRIYRAIEGRKPAHARVRID